MNSAPGTPAPVNPMCQGRGGREHTTSCPAGHVISEPFPPPAGVTPPTISREPGGGTSNWAEQFTITYDNMSIFENVLQLFPMENESLLLNIEKLPGHIVVHFRESITATPVHFTVDINCVNNLCNCKHYIAEIPTQLMPCCIFCECFLFGESDIDCLFGTFRGVVWFRYY